MFCHGNEAQAESDIKSSDLVGTWQQQYSETPWAVQFNEDGTYRTADTVLRLKNVPQDVGRFKLEGTTLTIISNDDSETPCKGLIGRYKIEMTEGRKLELIKQMEQCEERTSIYDQYWNKVSP